MNVLLDKLEQLRAKKDLRKNDAAEVFHYLRTSADQVMIARFLDAWAEKGVSPAELVACARIMRDNVIEVRTRFENFIDIVGTGGSKAKVFNVSTAAAFVVAGADLPVAKHGNRAASSRTGSADVLSELGVNLAAETGRVRECLDTVGICFMFAPKFHNLTRELANARKSLAKPTIFNLLGPLANPCNAPNQLIGVWDRALMKPMAEAAAELGTKRTWIVHGDDGLDEITLNGRTFVAEVFEGRVSYFDITPEDFGFEQNDLSEISGRSPEASAKIILNILKATEKCRAATDIVSINSAAAIYVAGKAGNFADSAESARKSIRDGSALGKLNDLIRETNK